MWEVEVSDSGLARIFYKEQIILCMMWHGESDDKLIEMAKARQAVESRFKDYIHKRLEIKEKNRKGWDL